MAVAIARALDEAKCEDIRVLDVRGLSQVTDYLVLASSTSERQSRTAVAKAAERAKELGATVFRQQDDPVWALLDLVDVVAHVFEPAARQHYALELLWGEGERVPWRDDVSAPPA